MSIPYRETGRENLTRLLKVSKLYYEERKSKKEIAVQLSREEASPGEAGKKIHPATVGRWLLRAEELGIVRITIRPPDDVRLGYDLFRFVHPFGIREVRVAGESQSDVGLSAARLFERSASSGQTLVLDGGTTVAALVQGLSGGDEIERLTVISVVSDAPSSSISSVELMTLASMKYLRSHRKPLPFHRGTPSLQRQLKDVQNLARQADWVFLGVSTPERGSTWQTTLEHIGINFHDLVAAHPDVAAVCACSTIAADGRKVTVPQMEERLMSALSYTDLRRLAAGSAKVVLLAASAKKACAVLAVLRARMVNLLVVDRELAEELINIFESENLMAL